MWNNVKTWFKSALELFYFNTFLPYLGNAGFILYGKGGGDSSPAPTQQTVTQTNLPEYAKPYFENLLKRTEALSYNQYQPYKGARIAGFTPEQQAIQQQYGQMQTPGQFGEASGAMRGIGGLGMGAAGLGLGQALSYDPNSANRFSGAAANYYMSPYQQAVTDIALREASQRGNLQKQANAMSSIGRGTFGGARQALLQAEGDRNLMQTLGDIQAKGSQDAFQQAQQQFNADEARRQQAMQYASTLGSQLFGQGIGTAQQSAAGLGALGSAQQAADLQRLGAQQSSAAQEQALQQSQLDTAYQDFLRQRDYPQEMLGFYSQILRGLPIQLASTTQSYQAPPSIGSQIAGLGIAGLGLSQLMK